MSKPKKHKLAITKTGTCLVDTPEQRAFVRGATGRVNAQLIKNRAKFVADRCDELLSIRHPYVNAAELQNMQTMVKLLDDMFDQLGVICCKGENVDSHILASEGGKS